jgi:hypothetical protein
MQNNNQLTRALLTEVPTVFRLFQHKAVTQQGLAPITDHTILLTTL